MSAPEPSSNLGGTKSLVSVSLPSVRVTSVIAAGCNITHTPFSRGLFSPRSVSTVQVKGLNKVTTRAIILQDGPECYQLPVTELTYLSEGGGGLDMWHRISNLDAANKLSGCIVHQIKGEIFQLVYSCLTNTYKHPTIHGASDIYSPDKRWWCARWEKIEDSAIFGSSVQRHGEWRNRKMNLTAPGIGSASLLRPTYINLLLLLCVSCVYLYTCLR